MNILKLASAASLCLFLLGCQNPYSKFYKSTIPSGAASELLPATGDPRIESGSGDPKADIRRMFEDGYALVGIASFVGPAQHESEAITQARNAGAAVVIPSSKYRNTVSGAMPVALPTTSTSYSSGTVNAYGAGGSAFGNYSGSTTTYGTTTTYIPFSVDKYDQVGLFFAALKPRGLGVLFLPLTDQQRQLVGSNKGVQLVAVRKGSPAFLADILPGDLLLSMGDEPIYDVATFHAAVLAAAGHATVFHLIRGTTPVTKQVTIPVGDW